MTEQDFWDSTLAKVTALYRVKILEWNRTRDFFQAQMVATMLNSTRTSQADRIYSAEDILTLRYPAEAVIITHDPDHGAAGDWRALRVQMRGSHA